MEETEPKNKRTEGAMEWRKGKWYRWWLDEAEGWVMEEMIPQPEAPHL